MANTSRAVLESALRARHLDRTLTTALPPVVPGDRTAVVPSEIAALDAVLRGGVPRGQLSEIAGPASSGRTTVLFSLLAAATRGGGIAALVDTVDRLDVPSAAAAGIELDRLLWVRGDAVSTAAHAGVSAPAVPALLDRVVDRAIKAFNLVLQAGGFSLVALDLADVPPRALTRIPFTTWLRVQRVIEGSDTACVIVVPEPCARSAGGLTLTLGAARPGGARWAGEGDRSRRLAGLRVDGRVLSPRRHVEGAVRFEAEAQTV